MGKMDEMEMSITLKAIKWSWFFTVISLFIWSVYDLSQTKSVSLVNVLFAMQFLVYFFVIQISKWRMGDENGRAAIVFYVISLIFFLLIFGVLLFFFHSPEPMMTTLLYMALALCVVAAVSLLSGLSSLITKKSKNRRLFGLIALAATTVSFLIYYYFRIVLSGGGFSDNRVTFVISAYAVSFIISIFLLLSGKRK